MLEQTDNVLHALSTVLKYPVIIILLILAAAAVVLVGSLLVEYFTERRTLKVSLPKLTDDLHKMDLSVEECIRKSKLLKRQKKILLELYKHKQIPVESREALAIQMLRKEKMHYDGILKLTDLIAKLGPMFGLMGTLIPLGPGIIALGQGDTETLSQSLLTAFDTTVAGLIAAAVALVLSTIRRRWYTEYAHVLEELAECVLERMKLDDKASN